MFKSIGMPEFYQETKKNKLSIIDVREQSEYESGHIPEAIHVPLSEINEQLGKLDKSTPYYLICQSGARSGMAGEFLGGQGYDVTNVLGGMGVWPGEIE